MLEGTKVVDLTGTVPGAFATKQLADFGAEVVKIESPLGGDPVRRLPPYRHDGGDASLRSAFFSYLSTNKKSIALDVAAPSGFAIVSRLVESADIVVDTFTSRVAGQLGITYEALKDLNPDIIYASITPFGRTGPYSEWRSCELTLYGMGGEMYSTGIPEREPLKMAGSVAEIESGAVAAVAILGALVARTTGLGGDSLDISCYEVQMSGIDRRSSALLGFQYTGEITPRRIGWSAGGFPAGVYPCQDGYFEISAGPPFWSRAVEMMGNPAELLDPRWTEPGANANPALKEEFDEIFLTWALSRTRREIWEAAQAAHVFVGPLNSIQDVTDDDHFRERGAFVEVEDAGGRLKMPGRPYLFTEGGWSLLHPAPRLGEHTDEVLKELAIPTRDADILRNAGVIL
ncbi:MAG: CoA transferase [Dehalococcoidia bacterium]